MNLTFIRRRHDHIGVLSDADLWQSHGRLRAAALAARKDNT